MERVFHLTSGELAELVGVTKQTVLYYDKVGLLCPKGRMSNRYRYYSLQQAAELRLILIFRELGMSIQEIRDYLQVRTPEAYLQVLGEQQERLQAEAARLQRMQERVARERRQLLELLPDIKLRIISHRFLRLSASRPMSASGTYVPILTVFSLLQM